MMRHRAPMKRRTKGILMRASHRRFRKVIALLLVGITAGLNGCAGERATGRWFRQPSGTQAAFFLVNFVDERHGWVVGWSGEEAKETEGWIVLTTSNAGVTWEPMPGQRERKIRSVYFVTPTTGWAITLERHILYTTDGGASWEVQRRAGTVRLRSASLPKGTLEQPEPIDHLFFLNETTGWAWGGGQRRPGFFQPGLLLRTVNRGRIWRELGYPFQNDLVALQFVDIERGWACENLGPCYRSDDGGQSWAKMPTREGLTVNGMHFVDRRHGWLVSNGGTALKTTDGGVTWKRRRTGVRQDLRDVFFLTPQWGWIVGNQGTVLFTSNGGNDWTPVNVGVQGDLTRVQFVSRRHGWVVGNNGLILHYVRKE